MSNTYLHRMKNISGRSEKTYKGQQKQPGATRSDDSDDSTHSNPSPSKNLTSNDPRQNIAKEDDDDLESTISEDGAEIIEEDTDVIEENRDVACIQEKSQSQEAPLISSTSIELKKTIETSPNKLGSKQNSSQFVKNGHSPAREALSSSKKCVDESVISNLITSLISYISKNPIPIIIFVVGIILYYSLRSRDFGNNFSPSMSPSDKLKEAQARKETIGELNKILAELKRTYNQTDLFWANIESSFKHSVVQSKDPSVVLFVNDRETKSLTQRLIVDIVKGLQYRVLKRKSPLTNLIIDPISDSSLKNLIDSNEMDKTKLYVDTKLDELFKSEEKLALIKNIELMPASTMILFYTYGDYENAKYPGVLIFMNLNLDETISSDQRQMFQENLSTLSEFVEGHLFELWSQEIGADQLRPLFTRIANNLVFVN